MTNVKNRAREAHRQSVEFTIGDIARFLQDTLGQSLTAHMAGVSNPKNVSLWAKAETTPRAKAEQRLRTAFQVFHMLQEEETPHTVRAWFIGLNPQLDEESPADAIRNDRLKDVLVAAKAYISGG